MDVFHAANKYSLKLIFSFLEYCDILRFLGSSHIIYDSLINETRQITISFKGLLKLLLDQSFFMKRIVDPSKQLSIIFASRGKESLMQGVKSSFPYFLLNPEVNFPSLFKLSSVPTFFLYLCEGYQCFTVRKLEILHDLDVNLSDYLSRHMIRVLEELVLPSWPIEVPFPQLAPTLQSLSVRRSAINALPPLPHLKRLYLKDCDNTDLDFTAYNLEALELINPRVLDFDKISSCARLVVHSPKEVKNIPNAKKFRQIEFADITIKNLPKESLQQVRELRLYYLRESEDVPLNLSSFTNLERFTLNSYHGKGIGLRFNPRAPSHLKVVHISLFGNAMNLSWFTNVHEIKLDFCAQVASLVGLEKVPRVILRDLDFLKSLNGLGKNDYVEVYDCASVKDFSAVKFVREVKIEECEKFRNSSDVAYVQKLIIISCEALIDLSGLVEVKELYLSHCDSVRYCEALKRITKLRISRCWKLRQSNLMQLNNFGGTIGAQDRLSSLTDCLHFEILKYLLQKEIREVISCNTHVYQRCIGRMHFPSPMSEDESKDKSNNVSFFPDSYHYTISWTIFESGEVQIPSFVQTLKFCFCKFSCSPNLIERLKRLEFYKCKGLSNIINFNIADEVIIEQGSSNNSLNLALLNQVKRLTLEDYYIKDYSPLQDIEEITVNYRLGRCNRAFQGSQAFSNTKKIKLYFKFLIDIEIDLAFYQKVEIFHLSGGDFNCNRPCPPTLRVLRLSILRKLTLPAGLDHLHQLHIADCRGFSSLQGLGSIPNIRLSALSDLKSLEGLGPGNEFVQLIDLDKVEDFSPVSGCRKVVIWDCLKFKDAPAFAESNYLVIGECDNLVDVSMLGKVKHLELIDCENIWSLKGLEGVKELIVSDCRLLEDQNNTRHRPWTVSEGY